MSLAGPAAVYLLCLLTSVGCAALLVRSWRRTRTRLLLWSALGFVLLAMNNLMLVLDLMVLPDVNLMPLRYATSLGAVAVLLYGFIWEVE
jgi:hypothetical protein